jgi:signal transduction histidine kinase
MALSRAARAYLALVALAAILVQGVLLAAPTRPFDPIVLGQLVVMGVLSQCFTLPAGAKRYLDFTIAAHFAVLLVAGLPTAMALVGAEVLLAKGGMAVWDSRRGARPRHTIRSVLFNASQSMLSVALAGRAAQLVPPELALATAGAVLYLSNTVLVAGMVALHQKRNLLEVWLENRAWSLLQTATPMLLAVAVVGASEAYVWAPLGMVLPAALTYLALKRTAEAEAAARLRDEFLHLAAHELRSPVTSVRAYAQLLRRQYEELGDTGVLDDPVRFGRAIRTIDQQAVKLARLIDQFLDLSVLDAGKLVLDRQPVDVAALVRQVVATCQPLFPENPICLRAAGPAVLLGDALRLEQMLTNLLTNAAKHGGKGQIDLAVEQLQARVQIEVCDRGPGIPPAERERIFDRYYQLSGTNGAGGLGLGLYLVHQIVQQHGGTITVDSPAGGGARFVVTLPTRLRHAGGHERAGHERAGHEGAARESAHPVPATASRQARGG